jgi:hypothetical protein
MKEIKKFEDFNINESKVSRFPELDKIADGLVKDVSKLINEKVKDIKSEMPYKAQYVLEELIRKLEDLV